MLQGIIIITVEITERKQKLSAEILREFMKYGNLLGEEIEPCIFVPCNHFNNYRLLGLFASFFPLPLFYDIITEGNNISSGVGSVSIRRQKFV